MTDRPLSPLMEAALRHLTQQQLFLTPSAIGRAIGVEGKARSSIGYRLSAVWRGLLARDLIMVDYQGDYGQVEYAATEKGRQWVADHPEPNA